jgi:hypothetical protein
MPITNLLGAYFSSSCSKSISICSSSTISITLPCDTLRPVAYHTTTTSSSSSPGHTLFPLKIRLIDAALTLSGLCIITRCLLLDHLLLEVIDRCKLSSGDAFRGYFGLLELFAHESLKVLFALARPGSSCVHLLSQVWCFRPCFVVLCVLRLCFICRLLEVLFVLSVGFQLAVSMRLLLLLWWQHL